MAVTHTHRCLKITYQIFFILLEQELTFISSFYFTVAWMTSQADFRTVAKRVIKDRVENLLLGNFSVVMTSQIRVFVG